MSADRRPQLLNAHFMIILALMLAAIVMVLYYKASNFEEALDDLHADALSVAYLKALLQAEPGDQAVRLKLVRHYLASGAWGLAEQALRAGGESLLRLSQAQWLMLQLRLVQYRATLPDQAQRHARQQAIVEQIKTLPVDGLSPEQLEELADISLQVNLPELAAGLYARLAVREPEKRPSRYNSAARCALAANRPLRAGDYYRSAFEAAAPGAKAVDMALAAARAYEAANRTDRALNVICEALRDQPRDKALLARGTALALARQQSELAYEWNSRYLELQPDDKAGLKRQRDLAVQLGRPKEALGYSERYLRYAAQDGDVMRLHAELAEWNGRYGEALQAWQRLAAKTADPEIYKHMQNLAQNSYQADAELSALDFLAARPGLQDAEILRMAERYEYLGYPEKADALFSARDRNRKLLIAQARLRERMGDPQMALETYQMLAERHDSSIGDRLELARLLWRMGRVRQAYQAILKLPADNIPTDHDADLLIGELAWQQGDYAMAVRVYRRLWEELTENDFARRRMVLAYRQLDRTADVVTLLQARWRRSGDPGDLMMAMLEARQAESWATLGHLLDMAGRAEDRFALDAAYWQLKGDWHSYRQEYTQSYEAYCRVLSLDPQAVAAADGILWNLINAGDRRLLENRLGVHIRAGLPQSEAYAAALQVLGRYRQALAWYQDRLVQHDNDALWLLDLADLLDKDGRADTALRLRRRALDVLAAIPGQVPVDRQALLIAELKGIPTAARWLSDQSAGDVSKAALVNWWLQNGHYDAARMWLLQHHVQRARLPGWRQLQLAMAEQDLPAVAELLKRGGLADTGDRMSAYAFLGHNDLALAEIGSLDRLSPGQRAAAAAAALRVPNFGELSFISSRRGELSIIDQQAFLKLSRGSQSWGLFAAQSRFEEQDDSGLAASPETESLFRVGWRLQAGGQWDFEAGMRDGNGGSVVPLKMAHRSPEGRRWQYQLALQENGLTEASALLRMLGVVDSVTTELDYRLDGRISTSLRGGLHRYRSLAGSELGDGWTAGLTLTYQLAGGASPCLVSAGAAWERNAVVDQLPADVRSRFTTDVGAAALVPETYHDIGLSIHMGRGMLRDDFPQVANPRWFSDFWIGYTEPGNGLAVAARTGLGISLLGGDEFGLTAGYDDRLNRTAGSGPGFELQVYYRNYFGR